MTYSEMEKHPAVYMMNNMTLQKACYELTTRFRDAGIDTAALDAKLLMGNALGLNATQLVSQSYCMLSDDDAARINTLALRREAREPLSHIVGYKEFWKDRFIVTRDVLTPRPDSETLIEAMLVHQPNTCASRRILDLGTGSGCLLLSLLREYPNAKGLGVDRSEPALSVAARNAQALKLKGRSFFAASHWMDALQSRFDMIISNPPYIKRNEALEPEVKEYEPQAALFGGESGLDAYHDILSALKPYLAENGVCVLEVGAAQVGDVTALAAQHGWKLSETRVDLAGVPRAIVLR